MHDANISTKAFFVIVSAFFTDYNGNRNTQITID